MAKKPREETRKVDDLKPHPFAQKVLGDPPFHEIAELAEDMKKNGQRDAIDIRPDGTILNGLTRWLAAKMAGITELRVVVHELDDTAAKKFVLESNLLRHHYSKLVIGRIYVELKKLARGRGKKAPPGEGDVRDRLAKRFGISGRTLDNLEAMLDAPVEVQAVYQEGDLPDGVILAVAKLSADLKKELVATLKTGDIDKEATIKAFLAAHKSPPAVTTNTKAGTKSATKPNAKSGTKPTKASDKADNKVNGKKHEDAAPTTQAGPEEGKQTTAKPEAAAEAAVDDVGHGDKTASESGTDGAAADESCETVETDEPSAEKDDEDAETAGEGTHVDNNEQDDGAGDDAWTWRMKINKWIETDDLVLIYWQVLEDLPELFAEFVEWLDDIVGEATDSHGGVVALRRIAASIQTLIEAEKALAEVQAGKA